MSENQLKQQHEFNKLHKRLRRQVGQAIADYDMIQDGDKVMVSQAAKTAIRCWIFC